jgi:hypothetical protein
MERQPFGDVARALAEGHLTRRRAWHVLGGALASVLTALANVIGQAKGDGDVQSQGDRNRRTRQFQCIPAGETCINVPKKRKKGAPPPPRLCRKKCCETFRVVNKKVGICCRTNGQGCSSAAECCLGSCSVGICQNQVIQFPPATCLELLTPCNAGDICCPVVKIGDICPTDTLQCAQIQSQKGPRTCGTPGSSGVAVCCRPNCGICSDDCECCGDLRCQNGLCVSPPPSCAGRGEACNVDKPCCITLGDSVSCSDGFCA